jgi:hypothetical protein
MTSINGTDSSYYSIANDHLYLYLNNGNGGIVGDTDMNYCNFYQFGIRDDKMILGKEFDSDLLNAKYINSLKNYKDKCTQNLTLNKPNVPKSSTTPTIYSILSEMPYVSETLKIVDATNYKNILDDKDREITFFAFDNESVDVFKEWIKNHYNESHYAKEFLKTNTLPFSLNPYALHNEKYRLTTMSPSNYVYADGRNNNLVFYVSGNELQMFNYPQQYVIIKVKGWIQVGKSWLYVLEAPILPEIII